MVLPTQRLHSMLQNLGARHFNERWHNSNGTQDPNLRQICSLWVSGAVSGSCIYTMNTSDSKDLILELGCHLLANSQSFSVCPILSLCRFDAPFCPPSPMLDQPIQTVMEIVPGPPKALLVVRGASFCIATTTIPHQSVMT